MVFLFQKYLWEEHLMKLSHLEKNILKKLRFLNQNQVRKDSKESFIICKKLDRDF